MGIGVTRKGSSDSAISAQDGDLGGESRVLCFWAGGVGHVSALGRVTALVLELRMALFSGMKSVAMIGPVLMGVLGTVKISGAVTGAVTEVAKWWVRWV